MLREGCGPLIYERTLTKPVLRKCGWQWLLWAYEFSCLVGRTKFYSTLSSLGFLLSPLPGQSHCVGEEAIQVSSWSWAPSIHCFSAWQSYFENGFVKSNFSSPLSVSPFLSSYNLCSWHWNWGIPPWRSSSVSLGGWRPPFRSLPHSPSTCNSHSLFLGHTAAVLSSLCLQMFSLSMGLCTLFSFGVGVWGRCWFCTVCCRKKASSPLLGALS